MTQHSPPDFQLRAYGPQRIAAVVETMAEDGIAPALVLAGSDLTQEDLRLPSTLVSYAQMEIVFANAAKLAIDPAVAFRAAMRTHLTAYGMFGYGVLSSPTQAEAEAFVLKYTRVPGPITNIVSFAKKGEITTYVFETLLSSASDSEAYRFALEFSFAVRLRHGRDSHGPSYSFAAANLIYPAPRHAHLYREWLGCPVQFDQPANSILVHSSTTDLPPRLPDPITHAVVSQTCDRMLAELPASAGMTSKVRRTLVERMPWRFPTIESMARELSMHSRTLRRRLEDEGTTYRDLLTEVRRQMAIEYLRKTHMTTDEIGRRLGYSDAANFRHAFVRWTGKNPRNYRPR